MVSIILQWHHYGESVSGLKEVYMKKITTLTRMNIINLYKYGFKYTGFITKIDYMEREYQEGINGKGVVNFNRRLNEIDFLRRLFDLEKL
ncbi:MAG: hypothetical protein CVU98_02915 [Firmicutes bacterium HGW-Firmicutes-3]|jgi:hypothetical protein|nr:MAG: hypothetical protein CVU98_02915 [Firmicutes bacterium HGW-Firmicutes-3]